MTPPGAGPVVNEVMIYGASGYTGALVARRASAAGLAPVLAGRTAAGVAPLAAELGLPVRVFGLDDPAAVAAGLDGIGALLNAAGPFEDTAAPLVDACLDARVHYLDLAGETPAFTAAEARHARAVEAGVMVLPGAGFGVVATDLVAAYAAQGLADVQQVDIAFRTVGGVSRGTAGALLPGLHRPGIRLVDGVAVAARPAAGAVRVDFGDGPTRAVLNPWRADLVTARHSTGASTVSTYQVLPGPLVGLMRAGRALRPVLDSRGWQAAVAAVVRRLPVGPDDAARTAGSVQARARARSADGTEGVAVLHGPEAYEFTAQSAAALLARAARGDAPTGFRTPVTAYGRELLGDLAGTRIDRRSPVAPAPG